MNLIEKIKQNENSPVYLAFTLGILLGTIIGFLVSPIKKGVTIGSYNHIVNNEDDMDAAKKKKKQTKVTRSASSKTNSHYQAPTAMDLIRASVRNFK